MINKIPRARIVNASILILEIYRIILGLLTRLRQSCFIVSYSIDGIRFDMSQRMYFQSPWQEKRTQVPLAAITFRYHCPKATSKLLHFPFYSEDNIADTFDHLFLFIFIHILALDGDQQGVRQVNIMAMIPAIQIQMKSILLLGSGLMAESVIIYLLANPKNHIHIASNLLAEAKKLAEKRGLDRCTYSEINVQDSAQLKSVVYTSDIVISYVPAFLHIHVAKACLELGKNLVTASYISKEMQDLDKEVKAKGLIFLNEMGLDPGIDHLATMKVIDEVKEQNGKIIEYESWCGGLPSPTCCDNPLGYKFTWSPIGALRALKNKAVYIDNGKNVEIEPQNLLYSSTEVRLNQALTLEGYPNRDSVSYRDVYGLNDAKKLLRGTLRYNGFTELINALKEIGLWTEEPVKGENWLEYIKILLQNEEGATLQDKIRNRTVLKVKQYSSASKEENNKRFERILRGLTFFRFLSNQKFYDKKLNNLENLVKLLQPKLNLKAGETDLVAMQHRFVIEIKGRRFLRKSSLIEIGDKNGFSAMSITVGVPSAIGAELVLQGKIKERGVLRPVYKDIYVPTLALLEKAGIRLVEEDEEL